MDVKLRHFCRSQVGGTSGGGQVRCLSGEAVGGAALRCRTRRGAASLTLEGLFG